jgi:murein DD-endopeptidase MepM/ murein hydrolase activator NlpD
MKAASINPTLTLKPALFPIALLLFLFACDPSTSSHTTSATETTETPEPEWPRFTHGNPWQYLDSLQPSDGFSPAVGVTNAKKYYDAQPFGRNAHLGEDWNAVTGGATDLGDPVHAIADGWVFFAQDMHVGWGKVVRIVHRCTSGDSIPFVESLYGHLDTMLVLNGDFVRRGQQIGTIGDAHGLYSPHLHLELRDSLGLGIGGGYSAETAGWLSPKEFMKGRRAEPSR